MAGGPLRSSGAVKLERAAGETRRIVELGVGRIRKEVGMWWSGKGGKEGERQATEARGC
jgi:hypothetical protein